MKDMWQLMNEFFRTRFNKYGVAISGDNYLLLTDKEIRELVINF